MTKLAFSNDTEGCFSGSCSGVYKMNYVIILHPSDGQRQCMWGSKTTQLTVHKSHTQPGIKTALQ